MSRTSTSPQKSSMIPAPLPLVASTGGDENEGEAGEVRMVVK
eukprot:CAMPEP_0118642990 /NCGR_PEP_ID=MMETSP0785-20121206/6136_1 /TAXON_ID=91992 /ORGANISM="Bolidomonas pacifica, Strain CCMP 1866" /LENGTH=41 /DNA_ID= /DNA_START= /DNA_END= /DNA_ORIENTATION=